MSWPEVPIGEIFEVARGGSPRPIDKFITDEPDGLNWVMIGDATASGKYIYETKKKIRPEGLKKTREVQPGDFILSNSMSFGKPYIMGIHGCIHDGWLLLRPQSDQIHPDYFYHLLGSEPVYQKFASRAAGATVKNLNSGIVREVEIPLPPLEEQKRIAGILDQAAELCRLRTRALDKLNTLGQAIFHEMFGDIKGSTFSSARFGEFADIQLGKMLDKGKFKGGDTKPYLRNANVRWFDFDLSDVSEMEFADNELERFRVEKNDLLICEGGEPGRCAVWASDDAELFYQKALHRARIDPTRATPDFIAYWFHIAAHTGQLADFVSSATIAHLTGAKIKTLPIILPPLELQRQFDERLEVVRRRASQAQRASEKATALFSSLQHRAFRGELGNV